MLKKLALVALTASFALPALAADGTELKESIELKDGSTVHVFQDGKMGMESKFGRAVVMDEGHVMETRDGQSITMKGNEVWRVYAFTATQP